MNVPVWDNESIRVELVLIAPGEDVGVLDGGPIQARSGARKEMRLVQESSKGVSRWASTQLPHPGQSPSVSSQRQQQAGLSLGPRPRGEGVLP